MSASLVGSEMCIRDSLRAPERERICVCPPAEAKVKTGYAWKLEKSLYGWRSAGGNFRIFFRGKLKEMGLE
eukprot:5465638-Alexandrium_andersonii.AAC.1